MAPTETSASINNWSTLLKNRRLVVVSNREPYRLKWDHDIPTLEKTSGGLVTALDPVLRQCGGLWICWQGSPGSDHSHDLPDPTLQLPYQLQKVELTQEEVNHYYYGYANRQLWPLFHYFPDKCVFDETDWQHYFSANQRFAQAILNQTHNDDLIWIQDYQLCLVPGIVRMEAPGRKLGFFCHIPFPSYELFRIMPRRRELLRGMLGSDLVGFHIPAYADNFLKCVSILLPGEADVHFSNRQVRYQGRTVQVGVFPISVDYEAVSQLAAKPEMRAEAKKLRKTFSVDFIGVGVDRLDYTKGILERLEAIRLFFEKYPQYRQRLVFIQIAAPTRTEVAEYQTLKEQIEQTVGRINGNLSEGSWTPIQYISRNHPLAALVPYFLISDFALISPLRDGMNLVAKEYCATRTEEDGVLILSELTGAAYQLHEALQVNPYSRHDVADAILEAVEMPLKEKRRRMHSLRQGIAENNIHRWVCQYLEAFQEALH